MEPTHPNLKKIERNGFIGLIAGVIDYLNLSAIYTSYFVPYFLPALTTVFRQIASFALFPLALLTSAIHTAVAWRNVHLDRDKNTHKTRKENTIRAIINTLSMVIIWTGIILGLGIPAAPSLGIILVTIFSINLALTGIYNCLAAGFHFYQAYKKKSEIEHLKASSQSTTITQLEVAQLEYDAQLITAKGHLFIGLTLGAIALTGGVVFLGGFAPFAALGIATGIIGAGFFGYFLANVLRRMFNESKIQESKEVCLVEGTNKHLLQAMPEKKNGHKKELIKTPSESPDRSPSLFRDTETVLLVRPVLEEPRRYCL